MTNFQNDDRRQFRRLKVNFTLTYRVGSPLALEFYINHDTKIDALMLDLSQNGMAISTSYNLPVSTVLYIKFTLINFSAGYQESSRAMEITGSVRSNIPFGNKERRIGIIFTKISDKDKTAIVEFIRTAYGTV